MARRWLPILATLAMGAAIAVGCATRAQRPSASSSTPPSKTGTSTGSPLPTDLVAIPPVTDRPATGTGTAGTVFPAGDIDETLRSQIDASADDLATRLGIAVGDITVMYAVAVIWPDGSLGCPKPGLAYPQVTTDGALIGLGVGTSTYRYHAGGDRNPFLCTVALTTAPRRLSP